MLKTGARFGIVALAGLCLTSSPAGLRLQAQSAGASQAYYTETQARRGQTLFQTRCSACHSAEARPADPGRPGQGVPPAPGFRIGSRTIPSYLGGQYLLEAQARGRRLYPTVYYVFRALESMPDVTDSISQDARADILAYLLETNGFSSGHTELAPDFAAMKLLPLDEPGFQQLFNGTDFAGWKFLLGLGCTPPPSGCGRSEPGTAFTVRDGVVVASGKTHGYMYTEERYKDFTLRLDYRLEPPEDWDGEDVLYYGNTGYLLFVQDENHHVWPKSIAMAGEQRVVLRPVALDASARSSYDADARDRAVRPLGEWNSIEIVSRDGGVIGYLNGTKVSEVTEHEFTEPGYIGPQLQGYPVEWRNIRIRQE